eukprot:1774234-Pyramimonas_sp.AAC.1
MNDFIVDEDDELDEQGNVIRRKEKKKRQSSIHGITGYALSEAQEIFGDTTDLLEMYQERKKQREQVEAEISENTEGLNEYRERKKQREQVEAEISENTEGLNEVQRNIPSPARGGWVVRCTLDPRRS